MLCTFGGLRSSVASRRGFTLPLAFRLPGKVLELISSDVTSDLSGIGSKRSALIGSDRIFGNVILSAANSTLMTYLIGAGRTAHSNWPEPDQVSAERPGNRAGRRVHLYGQCRRRHAFGIRDRQTGAIRALAGSPVPTGLNPAGIGLIHAARAFARALAKGGDDAQER
jgi:hypothetical protein